MTDETKSAADLVREMPDASLEDAQAVLDAELAKPEADQRVTVVRAAQARVEELTPVAEVQGTVLVDGPPDRAWAQLLDGDGEPVLVDGNPVETELTEPARVKS